MAIKLDRKNFMFTDKKNETLIKKKGDLNGLNFKIRNLQDCTVFLLDHTNGLFIDDCINCKIVVAPCNGSVMIRTSKNCVISIVAKQLRFRDCENVKIFSYIESDPVVESCTEIHFGPYNAFLPAQNELFTKANFTPKINTFHQVYDFTEKLNTDSIHWKIINGNIEREIVQIDEIIDEIQGLYPGYEEELAFYIQNGKLPYEVKKENVEGENIPIDTTLVSKTGSVTQINLTNIPEVVTNKAVFQQNDLISDMQFKNNEITKKEENTMPDFFQDSGVKIEDKQQSLNNNIFSPNSFNNNIGSTPYFPFENNFQENSNMKQYNAEDIEITNSYNLSNLNPTIEERNIIPQDYISSFNNNAFGITNPDDVLAQKNARFEEEKLIKRLMERQIKESKDKKEFKSKARDFLESFDQKRKKNIELRHNANIQQEKLLVENKSNSTNNENPWDRVVSLIDVKETDYKGSKNVERMRQCIISRRYDASKFHKKK